MIDPTPAVFESNFCFFPFFLTETAVGLLTWMVMESVTVYVFFHGPVTCSATSLLPSTSISTHETSPSATDTVTFVSVFASFSAFAFFSAAAAAAASSASFFSVDVFEELFFLLSEELEVETATVFSVAVPWFLTHELTDDMMTTVMMRAATTSANAAARRPSEKNASTTPRTPPCRGARRRLSRCWREPRPRCGGRRRTLGRCMFAMLRDDWRPDRVDAASYGRASS